MVSHYTPLLKRGGGPSGYLFNLKDYAERNSLEFRLITDVPCGEPAQSPGRPSPVLKSLPESLFGCYLFLKLARAFRAKRCDLRDRLSKYESVVFHGVFHAAGFLNAGGSCSSGIAVMNHSPTYAVDEIVEDYCLRYRKRVSPFLQRRLRALEYAVYKKVKNIIVPTRFALEAYNSENVFRHMVQTGEIEVHEVPTGIAPRFASQPRNVTRAALGIGDRQFVIGYFGRYQTHKGYDIFCDVAERCHRDGVTFVSAGSGPLRARAKVRDLGWRSDVNELITACDLILQPNRATYFDLLTLEVLSLGTPCMITAVGGGRLFGELQVQGVKLISSLAVDDWARAIQHFSLDAGRDVHLPDRFSIDNCINAWQSLRLK